jgi:hypothetical protein
MENAIVANINIVLRIKLGQNLKTILIITIYYVAMPKMKNLTPYVPDFVSYGSMKWFTPFQVTLAPSFVNGMEFDKRIHLSIDAAGHI